MKAPSRFFLWFVLIVCPSNIIQAQGFWSQSDFHFGLAYNQSNDDFNNTTGIGLILESNYYVRKQLRVGIRLEPVALVSGVFVYPGGCQNEHPRYRDIPSCREGSNHLLNSYLKADYFFSQNSEKKSRWFVGSSISLLTQNRFIITQRITGNWLDTEKIITNVGIGVRTGISMNRIELSTSFIIAGPDYTNYVGMNISYKLNNFGKTLQS
jgi:hypothetical protein